MKNRFAEKRGFGSLRRLCRRAILSDSVRNHFTMNYEMISSKGEETLAQLASRLGGASHADFGLEAACTGLAGGYCYGQGGAPKGQRKGSQGVARQDGQLTVERAFFGRSFREEAVALGGRGWFLRTTQGSVSLSSAACSVSAVLHGTDGQARKTAAILR